MINTYKNKDLTWIDIESPTHEELAPIIKKFDINPLVAGELLVPSARPKVDTHKNFMYLILHFPKYKHKENKSESQEVDFIIGKNFLITTHYDTINSIYEFSKIFETESILEKLKLDDDAGILFSSLIRKMYEYLEFELEHLDEGLEKIEKKMFDSDENTAESLSKINKELIDFKRTLRSHREIIQSFNQSSQKFFGKDFSYYSMSILGAHERIWDLLESTKEILIDIRQTSDSLSASKTNSIVKKLTILTFISIPVTIVANIMGVNAENIPIIGHRLDFWIIIGIMITITLLLFLFFKYKKWL